MINNIPEKKHVKKMLECNARSVYNSVQINLY